MPACRAAMFALLMVALGSGVARAESEPLTVVSWGGTYEAAQRDALFGPWSALSGREIRTVEYNGNADLLATRASAEGWQVIDMTEDEAIRACDQGLLHPLDSDVLGLDNDIADFVPQSLRSCSVAQNLYATVMAFDERAFPGIKPGKLEHFFDLKRFPGKRGIRASPDAILEWALMAEGVPARQVYDLLSTDRGLRLALRKLESLGDQIVWWSEVSEPEQLLASGEVTMTTGYNGRLFNAIHEKDLPLTLIWDGQIVAKEVWAIIKDSADIETSLQFLQFALQPAAMARLAERIPYAPTRRSALERIGIHPESRVPMLFHLPAAPGHTGRILFSDSLWYARTRALRERRFVAWRLEREKGLR